MNTAIHRYKDKEDFLKDAILFADKELEWMMKHQPKRFDPKSEKYLERDIENLEKVNEDKLEDYLLAKLKILEHSDHYWSPVEVGAQTIILLSIFYKLYDSHMACMSYIMGKNAMNDVLVEEIMFVESDFFDFTYWDQVHVNYVCDFFSSYVTPEGRYDGLYELKEIVPNDDTRFLKKIDSIIKACENNVTKQSGRKESLARRYSLTISKKKSQVEELRRILPALKEEMEHVKASGIVKERTSKYTYEKLFSSIMERVSVNMTMVKYKSLECYLAFENSFNEAMKREKRETAFYKIVDDVEAKLQTLEEDVCMYEERMKHIGEEAENPVFKYETRTRIDWDSVWHSMHVSNAFLKKYRRLYRFNMNQIEKCKKYEQK